MNIADNPILTADQKSLLRSFSKSDLRFSFYLTGGTSLSAFYLFHRLSEDLVFFSEGPIDSLKDILVNKLMAVTDRREPKDFVDLYFALRSRSDLNIDDLAQATESKFGVKGVKYVLRGRFVEALPPLGTLLMKQELDVKDLSRFFKRLAMTWIRSEIGKQL